MPFADAVPVEAQLLEQHGVVDDLVEPFRGSGFAAGQRVRRMIDQRQPDACRCAARPFDLLARRALNRASGSRRRGELPQQQQMALASRPRSTCRRRTPCMVIKARGGEVEDSEAVAMAYS